MVTEFLYEMIKRVYWIDVLFCFSGVGVGFRACVEERNVRVARLGYEMID